MRHFLTIALSLAALALLPACGNNSDNPDDTQIVPPEEPTASFAKGVDISWCTEMEAAGRQFRDKDGNVCELFSLMKSIGMDAVRLRVWVNPERYGYGAWCDLDDVLVKARRAKAQGLDILMDFHYSDFFADPGRQLIPLDWEGLDVNGLAEAVNTHTKEVLSALKAEGIDVKWVQTGNETNSGMLWDVGKIDWKADASKRYDNYVRLHNAAFSAVKAVYPKAPVILHYAGVNEASEYEGWFFKEVIDAGAKLDMIGLSHYPDGTAWSSTEKGAVSNANAAEGIRSLYNRFGIPIMVVETGFSCADPSLASQVMSDLLYRLSRIEGCEGVFYWEPEVDGQWKPAFYNTLGWGPYQMGAFTTDGRPTAALDAFGN
ncbi:MAG: glycosyl hydrolase 53 family protein [Candidatus Cryptobacteroides sp.]